MQTDTTRPDLDVNHSRKDRSWCYVLLVSTWAGLVSPIALLVATEARCEETGRSGLTVQQQSSQLAATSESAEKRVSDSTPRTAAHPLDRALTVAREGAEHIQQNVRDYTATLVKRERINGELTDHQYLLVKIRHRKVVEGRSVVPLSVYLKFLKPENVTGREVIWVEGRNDGKLIAHETGIKNLLRFKLDPDGFVAMLGNRYPINQIGFLNLVEELIKKGEQDRKRQECEVRFIEGAKVNGRVCTMIQVQHPTRCPYFDFYRARIFIDDELNIPIRYAAWTWPPAENAEPVLEEEYTYIGVKLNVGLTDQDFSPDNPKYDYP